MRAFFPVALLALAVGGCGDSAVGGAPTASERFSLVQLQDCSEIERYVEEVATTEMERTLDRDYFYGGDLRELGAPVATSGAPTAAAQSDMSRAATASGTNNQEAGVDEPDFVKNDNELLFVLRNGKLVIVDAFPAAQMRTLSRTGIEGQGIGLVRQGNRVLTLSTTPAPLSIARADVSPGAIAPAIASIAPCGPAVDCPPYGQTVTKLTLLDISNLEAPVVVRELYLEGAYQTARLIAGRLYVMTSALTPGPTLDYNGSESDPVRYAAAVASYKLRNRATIAAQPVDTWLPRIAERRAGVETAGTLGGCRNFYRPRTPQGRTILSLSSVSLADATGPVEAASIVSQSGTVYASAESVYVALFLPSYGFAWRRGGPIPLPADVATSVGSAAASGATTTSLALESDRLLPPEETSLIHKFDLTGSVPLYAATGEVEGHVLNQLSMDEQSGVLRVATTTDGWASDGSRIESESHFFNLTEQGGRLRQVGAVRGLAPGERIMSARFFDNRGFIVTFRQTDPLFSLDLTDPAAPAVRSALKITGFAQYIHPIDGGNALLTFGQEADANGRVTGMALTLFDVADLSNTTLRFRSDLGQGSSEAQWDHLAFNYFPSAGVLALPVQSWGVANEFSGIEVWNVSTTAGFSLRGRVDHRDLVPGLSGGPVSPAYYGLPSVRRSVILDRALYSISDAGIKVHSLDSLSAPLAPAIVLR